MFIDDLEKSILQKAMNGELIEGSNYNSREENKMEDCCTKIETGNSISENVKKTKYTNLDTGYNFIATKDLEFNHSFQYENGIKIPYDEPNFKYADTDNILLCIEGGSAGRKIGILSQKVCYGNKLCKFSVKEFINPRFLYYFLQSPDFQKLFRENINGLIGGVSIGKIRKLVLKYPPLEEQKRIVAKLDELMPLLEEARPLEEEITKLEKDFPSKLRQSILQYAIQGKLVEQNSEDEPASELLKKIKEEKEKLIKEGKIKKEKPLEPITDEEKLFDIPNSWEWVRLGEIINIKSGDGLTSYQMKQGNIPVFGGNGIAGYHNEPNIFEKTIVIGRVGFYCGSVHITPEKAWVTDNAFITTFPKKFIDTSFLVYVLKYLDLGKDSGATAQPVVSGKKVYPILCPIPPLEEQKRIVAKLDELMKLCDELEEQIG